MKQEKCSYLLVICSYIRFGIKDDPLFIILCGSILFDLIIYLVWEIGLNFTSGKIEVTLVKPQVISGILIYFIISENIANKIFIIKLIQIIIMIINFHVRHKHMSHS